MSAIDSNKEINASAAGSGEIQDVNLILNDWRSRTTSTMLYVVAVFGALNIFALFADTVKKPEQEPILVVFTSAYLVLVSLMFLKRVNWRIRTWGMLVVIYLVGLIALARGGLAGAGREYLIILPILATVLISIRSGITSAIISLLVMFGFAFASDAGYLETILIYQQNPQSLEIWAVEVTYTVTMMGVATSLVILFHRYVIKILLVERRTTQELEIAHARLEEYSQQLEVKVSERTAELAQAYEVVEQSRQRMKSELVMAGRLQANFMSQKLPHISGWQCAGEFLPARETTGDFYYLASYGGERYGILIADVVDKGIGAALLMSFCWGLAHTLTSQHPDRPDWVARRLNQSLCRDTHSGQFVTLFYGFLDAKAETMTYINAGHNPPLLFNQTQRSVRSLSPTGTPLGIFTDRNWTTECAHFMPGDCLVLYTDGVIDAENSQHEHFGSDRLTELVLANLEKPATEVQSTIIEQVKIFTENQQTFDDLTLLVLQRER